MREEAGGGSERVAGWADIRSSSRRLTTRIIRSLRPRSRLESTVSLNRAGGVRRPERGDQWCVEIRRDVGAASAGCSQTDIRASYYEEGLVALAPNSTKAQLHCCLHRLSRGFGSGGCVRDTHPATRHVSR